MGIRFMMSELVKVKCSRVIMLVSKIRGARRVVETGFSPGFDGVEC